MLLRLSIGHRYLSCSSRDRSKRTFRLGQNETQESIGEGTICEPVIEWVRFGLEDETISEWKVADLYTFQDRMDGGVEKRTFTIDLSHAHTASASDSVYVRYASGKFRIGRSRRGGPTPRDMIAGIEKLRRAGLPLEWVENALYMEDCLSITGMKVIPVFPSYLLLAELAGEIELREGDCQVGRWQNKLVKEIRGISRASLFERYPGYRRAKTHLANKLSSSLSELSVYRLALGLSNRVVLNPGASRDLTIDNIGVEVWTPSEPHWTNDMGLSFPVKPHMGMVRRSISPDSVFQHLSVQTARRLDHEFRQDAKIVVVDVSHLMSGKELLALPGLFGGDWSFGQAFEKARNQLPNHGRSVIYFTAGGDQDFVAGAVPYGKVLRLAGVPPE